MDAGNQAELVALGWIVTGALVAVIAATVALIRSGRVVPLPRVRWRSRLRHAAPSGRRARRARTERGRRADAEATRERPPGPAGHARRPASR